MQLHHGCRAVAILLLAGAFAAAQTGESVLVPAKDYQKLLDDLEAAKKAKAAKPLPPGVCHIECELKRTKERPLAALTLTYQFRTTAPRSMVMLGGQRGFAVKASLDDGGTPALEATADGLVATIDAPGEHTLTLHLETAIAPRGAKGDVGFDIGLPRAAITTLTLTPPELKSVSLGTRWAEGNRPGELKTLAMDPNRLAKSYPLGPTDVLELAWDVPKTVPPVTEPTLDAEITVRVEDARVETVATLKLRGPAKEWTLSLPPGAELTGNATIVKPEAKKREWKVTLTGSEATLTATVRQPRAEPNTFSVGPFLALGSVRQSGTVKLFAPPTLRLILRPTAEVRRVELPADDSAVAGFRYSFAPGPERKPAALVEFDVRPASGFVVVQPHHKLSLTVLGWKLQSAYRIAPVRTGVEQITLELPAGWEPPQFSPLDLVEEVSGGGDAGTVRMLQVRLAVPQREPFELVLETRWPTTPEMRDVSLPLPRILSARERDTQVSVQVPESLELTGSVREGDAAKPAATASELKRQKHNVLAGSFDGSVARVDLAWQAFRARIAAETRVEITLSERQMTIAQTIALSFPDGAKTVRLSGPAAAAGFRAIPALESTGPGEWSYTPPAGARDATLTISYAVPMKLADGSQRVAVPLVWPEAMTANTSVRVWSATAFRRTVGFDGPWRESPPAPSADRDSLPMLTLASTTVNAALALEVAEADPAGSVIVDRAVEQWWIAEAGSVQGRSRYLLRRWPATLEIDLASTTGLTVFVDKARVEPTAIRGNTVRIALPEAKPSRPTLLLELRFTGPPSADWTELRLAPPTLRGTVYRTPTWWQIALPDGSIPIALHGDLAPDIGWRWTSTGFAPIAGVSSEDLDRWLNDAHVDAPASDHSLTAQQALPAPVKLLQIPRLIAMAILAVLVLGLGLTLTRLRTGWRLVWLGVLAAVLAAVAIHWPQPVSQLVCLAQPGLALLAAVLLGQKLLRSWQSSRSTATFTRAPVANGVPSSPTIELPARRSTSGAASQPVAP